MFPRSKKDKETPPGRLALCTLCGRWLDSICSYGVCISCHKGALDHAHQKDADLVKDTMQLIEQQQKQRQGQAAAQEQATTTPINADASRPYQ